MGFKYWHNFGYEGKGIRLFEIENNGRHQSHIQTIEKTLLPKCEIRNIDDADCYLSSTDRMISYLREYKPHVIGTSLKLSNIPQWEKLVDWCYSEGIPFFMVSGNDGDQITDDELGYNNKVICCGAIQKDFKTKTCYSEWGKALDFSCPIIYSKSGTSFTRPILMCAAAMIMGKVGRLNMQQVEELFKKYSNIEFDEKIGYGTPRLPHPNILEEGEKMNTSDKIILHHSATNGGTFESIRRYHMNKGWRDIGYHYLIEMDGSLHVGRAEETTGAHTLGENESSIGICIVGDFDKYFPNKEQLKTLDGLIKDIFDRRSKIPIRKHSDYANKTCPGVNFPFNKVVSDAFLDNKKEDISEWAKIAWDKAKRKGINDGIGAKNQVTEEQLMVFFDRLRLLD